jgi:tetratricopeptide (TPR) repeat protein
MNANKAREVFVEIVANVPAEQWDARLLELAGDDDEVRHRVELLLAAHRQGGSFLASPAAALGITVDDPITERPGTVIGPYKLLQQIGEGGMGTVFMAEQTHPVQRKVALKIIKPGMDSRQVIGRFDAERQALALMDHPNIAKVLDAGATESGRPYFVMELVKGVPITKYSDEHRLTPNQRLELFLPVCHAVQHAHQKGIIHRDLKPSNVLVAEYDDKPMAKVIDFGVAKATGPKLTEQTMFTEFGQVVGTLEYMSPEQAKFNALDIDTRSDIYALGVLLYELLTGTTPFERKRLKHAAFDEILRIIREEEPPKPSTRLSTTEELPSIAANRGLEPKKLSGLVRGELDWIVMKCLEKDRNRRYETANGLARDVERYLHDEPVQACPPSAGYRLRKFARRHKLAFAMASVVSALLVLSVLILAVSNIRIQREREQKDAAFKQAQENLHLALKALDEIYLQVAEERLPRDPQRKKEDEELLQKALGFYLQFAEGNNTQSSVRLEVSRAHRRAGDIKRFVGDHAAAQQGYRLAIVPAQELTAEFPGQPEYAYELAVTHNALAEELLSTGQMLAAAEQFRKAIELLTKLSADYPRVPQYRAELARSHHGLGKLHKQQGERNAAGVSFQEALDIQSKLSAEFPSVAQYRADLAQIHRHLGLWLEGSHWISSTPQEIDHVRQACKIFKDLVGDFPGVPMYRQRLASTLDNLAMLDRPEQERIDSDRQAIAILTKLAADFPQVPDYRAELSVCYGNLGETYRIFGDWETAGKCWRQSLDLQTTLVAKYPTVTDYRANMVFILVVWGEFLVYRGDLAGGRKAFEEAVTRAQADVKIYANDPWHAQYRSLGNYLLSVTLVALGDSAEAAKRRKQGDQLFDDTWQQLQTVRGPSTAASFCADAADELRLVGDGLKHKGRQQDMANVYGMAIKALSQAIELDRNNLRALDLRRYVYGQLGQLDKAIADLTKAIELDPKLASGWNNRGWAYGNLGQWENALADCTKAIELDPKLVTAWNNRGWIYGNLGQAEKAIADYYKAIDVDPENATTFKNLAWLLATCPDSKFRDARKAVELAKKVIELDPNNAGLWNWQADLYVQLGQHDKAVEAFSQAGAVAERVALNSPDDPQRFMTFDDCKARLAAHFIGTGRLRDGLKFYTGAIERQPKEPSAWLRRAEFYVQLGLWDLAAPDFGEAFKLRPPATPYQCMAQSLLSLYVGDTASYHKLCAFVPTYFKPESWHPSLLNALVRACTYAAGPQADLGWAVTAAEYGVKKEPKGPCNYTTLGLAYYRAARYEAAIEQLQQSLKVDPNWVAGAHTYPVLAMGYHRLGRAKEAREVLNKATRSMDQWSNEFFRRPVGSLPLLWWDWMSSLLLYREAKIAIDGFPPPEDPRLYVARARALVALGDNQRAALAWEKAVEFGGQNPAILLESSNALGAMGRWDKAIAGYTTAIELDQKSALTLNNLAWLLTTCPDLKFRDGTKAVGLAKKAIDLAAKEGDYWNTLGAAYCRAGDSKAAIAALQKSMELRKGGDSFDWFFLAMAHWQMGKKDEARKWYDKGVGWMEKNQPENEELLRFRAEAAELLGIKEEK